MHKGGVELFLKSSKAQTVRQKIDRFDYCISFLLLLEQMATDFLTSTSTPLLSHCSVVQSPVSSAGRLALVPIRLPWTLIWRVWARIHFQTHLGCQQSSVPCSCGACWLSAQGAIPASRGHSHSLFLGLIPLSSKPATVSQVFLMV